MARRVLLARMQRRRRSAGAREDDLRGRGARRRGAPRRVAVEAVTIATDLRALYPRVLGRTLALTRSLADAEDAVQDAIERALATWPQSGSPDSPEAWLVTVAAN